MLPICLFVYFALFFIFYFGAKDQSEECAHTCLMFHNEIQASCIITVKKLLSS